MLLQVLNARDSLLDARPMSDRHPPQHDGRSFKTLKPIGAAAIEALVDRLPHETFERLDALPDRHVDQHVRVGEGDVAEQYVKKAMLRFAKTAYDNWVAHEKSLRAK